MELQSALALHRAGELVEAAAAYEAVLASCEDVVALGNLGSIRRAQGRIAEAETLLRRAVDLRPDRTPALLNLANLLWRTGRLADAARAYERVLAIEPQHPTAAFDLGNVLLLAGDDLRGWSLYDERPGRKDGSKRTLSFPEWQGEPIDGKRLLVVAEQGFGDQIFASRYLTGLPIAPTVLCWPELVRLFAQLPVTPVAWREAMRIGSFDYWTLAMSLPRWATPAPGSYLRGCPKSTGSIGVAWRGSSLPDPRRSLSAEAAAALLALPGASSLQPEETGARDFQDTADLIAGLEVVISIDTSVAHLAGAMGKRTILLLHHESYDWRWRPNKPWYPTVEIVRQSKPGDWTVPIARAAELALNQ